jgi:hypothetical protein
VNIEMAVSTSMKLVDSDGTLSRDIDAPENDSASVSDRSVNQIFRFRAIRSAMLPAHDAR